MIAKLADALEDVLPDRASEPPVIEKRDVLRPGEPDHDPQAVSRCLVDEFAARRRVQTNRVEPKARDQTEVFGDLPGGWKLVTLIVGCKRPVRDALHEESFVTGVQELPLGDDARGRRWRRVTANVRVQLKGCTHVG